MRIIYCALLTLLMGMSSCKNEDSKNDQKVSTSDKKTKELALKNYTSDSLHVSFSYPADWEVRLNGNHLGIFEPLKDSGDAFQENVMIWTEDMPMQISDSLFGKAATTEIKIKNPDTQVTQEGIRKLGNQDFYHFEFDYTNSGNIKYHIFGYTLVNKQRGYNFSCTAELEKASIHAPLFESILSSFKPL